MYEQNASYLMKHSELGAKNSNKICLKIVQKVLKWPLRYVNFQKFSGEHMSPDPLEAFLILRYMYLGGPANTIFALIQPLLEIFV